MCRKFVNHWVEYSNPFDLMDRSSNMKIGLCWYQKGQQQVDLQSYQSFDEKLHKILLIFEMIIALAFMT